MQHWRLFRGWSEEELKQSLEAMKERPVSFDVPFELMNPENGWKIDGSDDVLGCEPPGPPLEDGLFTRARQGIINYDFSDPRIVEGHFDPDDPLEGRDMLLEIKAFGLHYLNGVRVHSIREEYQQEVSVFGFRYDTLEGHIEQGCEWFLLTKDHKTGEVRFTIEAHWRLGGFPNWWSRLGFILIGEHFRRFWRREAPMRLRRLAQKPVEKPVAEPGRLAHRGDPKPKLSGPPGDPGRAGVR